MAPAGLQPRFISEYNWATLQANLPHAILVSSRCSPIHPQKASRLEFVEHLILQGADPQRSMKIQGEEVSPLQRAIQYGDPMTIRTIQKAIELFKQEAPLIILPDVDKRMEESSQQKLPIAILFPGQGSQYVKMLAEVKELEPCKRLIEKANAILGYDLLDLCLNGPEDKLEETKFCQPAMFLANCCALEKLRLEKPEVVERCSATAGLSLGEYNAICFSGMLSFEECLKVVRVRADAMQEESLRSQQAMISVAGLDLAVLESLCEKAARQAGNLGEREAVCKVANHLFPKGYTCSGDKSAVELLKGFCEKEGALQARYLKTSGAFHTSLMEPAGVKLLKALRVRVTEMNFPRVDVYMNVRGAPQKAGTDPREINYDLAEQVASPVLWQASIQEMMKNGITEFYECGPMKQLKAMMKRISQEAWERTTNVSV